MAFRAEITIRTRIIAIWWKSSFRLWGPTALPPASATSVCRTGVPTRIYEIAPVSAPGALSQTAKLAEVVQTEASSGIDFDAEVCPTAAPKTDGNDLA